MEACIFRSFMSVIVNGSVKEDFTVERGIRQGDQLSPLLFVLVMEGLTSLVDRAVEVGDFKGLVSFNLSTSPVCRCVIPQNLPMLFKTQSSKNTVSYTKAL